jgi:hypothetical protein
MQQLEAVEGLLERAKEAHGEYERTELDGVYDEDWPRWYAHYVVDNGLSDMLGRSVAADEVAALFTKSWAEFSATVFEAEEAWTIYTARRMIEELAA